MRQAISGTEYVCSTTAYRVRTISKAPCLARMISATVYVGLACVAVLAQGGTALYYFTREKHIRAYREQTPPWIVEMQRQSGAPL